MNKNRLGTFLTITIGLIAVVSSSAVLAQSNQGEGQALEIAPPVITLSSDPGKTIKTTINLRDVSKTPLVVSNEINDFTAAGLDGTPNIVLDDVAPGPYSLRTWISPVAQLLLKPGEIKQLPVTIVVPQNASPGAHYGVIRFTGTPPDLDGQGVSLSASLGALVLLKVNGDIKEDLSLAEFSVKHNGKGGPVFESAPLDFSQKIKNNGTMFEAPVGQVTIENMFGKTIAAVNINLDKRNVLPESTREFKGPLNESVIGKKKLFGHYTAHLHMTYGAKSQTLDGTLSFWVIPYRMIAAVIVAIIIGFFILRFLISRYNRRIINMSQKSKTKSKSKNKR